MNSSLVLKSVNIEFNYVRRTDLAQKLSLYNRVSALSDSELFASSLFDKLLSVIGFREYRPGRDLTQFDHRVEQDRLQAHW